MDATCRRRFWVLSLPVPLASETRSCKRYSTSSPCKKIWIEQLKLRRQVSQRCRSSFLWCELCLFKPATPWTITNEPFTKSQIYNTLQNSHLRKSVLTFSRRSLISDPADASSPPRWDAPSAPSGAPTFYLHSSGQPTMYKNSNCSSSLDWSAYNVQSPTVYLHWSDQPTNSNHLSSMSDQPTMYRISNCSSSLVWSAYKLPTIYLHWSDQPTMYRISNRISSLVWSAYNVQNLQPYIFIGLISLQCTETPYISIHTETSYEPSHRSSCKYPSSGFLCSCSVRTLAHPSYIG